MEAKEQMAAANPPSPERPKLTVNVVESVHRWDVRAALLDGPKTAQQAANWAREHGNQHIDRALADNILRNLIRAEEVGIDVSVPAGKPPVFVATASMKRPPTEQPAAKAAPAADVQPADLPPPVLSSEALAACIKEIAAECRQLRAGDTFTASVPLGADPGDFAQRLRLSLGNNVPTRSYFWSVIRKQVPDQRVLVTNRGLKRQPTPPALPAATEIPAPKTGQWEEGPPITGVRPAVYPGAFQPPPMPVAKISIPVREEPAPVLSHPPVRWEAGHAALNQVNEKIRVLLDLRVALERVIPMMEQKP